MPNNPRTTGSERCVREPEQMPLLPMGTNPQDCRRADEGMDWFDRPNDWSCVCLYVAVIER